ncbi:hypothetical protein FB45DRAFT_458855 [Roridomyces roridus]|uniref:Uncharacterized protein n=1 Tax=Roridomyces roridus TaxID=1738132 RepID=A0AAD7B058_9AGAR|nr:hypothetical protein FB45DRAFT_458855 [Roridomyces roridus]
MVPTASVWRHVLAHLHCRFVFGAPVFLCIEHQWLETAAGCSHQICRGIWLFLVWPPHCPRLRFLRSVGALTHSLLISLFTPSRPHFPRTASPPLDFILALPWAPPCRTSCLLNTGSTLLETAVFVPVPLTSDHHQHILCWVRWEDFSFLLTLAPHLGYNLGSHPYLVRWENILPFPVFTTFLFFLPSQRWECQELGLFASVRIVCIRILDVQPTYDMNQSFYLLDFHVPCRTIVHLRTRVSPQS